MDRRSALKTLLLSGGAISVSAWLDTLPAQSTITKNPVRFSELENEPPLRAQVRTERGGPRLFINDQEVYPLLGLSTGILQVAWAFRQASIDMLQPILGMKTFWTAPGQYDWDLFDRFMDDLLHICPNAYFLPRLALNAPFWWLDAHPDERIDYGLPTPPAEYRKDLSIQPGGYAWGTGSDLYAASWASDKWRADTADMLSAFLDHIESSPLKSRIIGYHHTDGLTGEWGIFGANYFPDYSQPMQTKIGPIPTPQDRMRTTFGLLRDPVKEKHVIDYYKRFHGLVSDTILYFARVIKERTKRRVLCGTFYGYVMESNRMQEIGYLDPQPILDSPDIDYITSPYAYLHTNDPERPRWTSDVFDHKGNWLGRARGVGGDGGYRVLVESLRRRGKLFIVEMDPSTYLEPQTTSEGGSGKQTREGTLKILERDLAKMLATGNAGWLYDFGPIRSRRGWYTSLPIIRLFKKYKLLGSKLRPRQDISSVAEMVCIADSGSYLVSQHWKETEPYFRMGNYYMDYINHWFHTSQHRSLSRMAAPMDYLYAFDLNPKDVERYRLIIMTNAFLMSSQRVKELRSMLKNSGVTVVWMYAPGYVNERGFDLSQMESLTGISFDQITKPGPMTIRSHAPGPELTFGVESFQYPRFVVADPEADCLGVWTDLDQPAYAVKDVDGFTSVYVGSAPIPVEVLQYIQRIAGLTPWSTRPDIIKASRDLVMLVATSDGERELTLPSEMREIDGGQSARKHILTCEFGEVRLFSSLS